MYVVALDRIFIATDMSISADAVSVKSVEPVSSGEPDSAKCVLTNITYEIMRQPVFDAEIGESHSSLKVG